MQKRWWWMAVAALVVSACGGGSDDDGSATAANGDVAAEDGGGDASADSTQDDTSTDSGSGDGTGANGQPIESFDAGALGSAPVELVHLLPRDRSGPTPPPPVDPVIDTCAALGADEISTLADDADVFGGYAFEATSLGAACDYRDDTHLVRVIIGRSDQVTSAADGPAMVLPIGAGEVTEQDAPDVASVSVLSEDSFGIDTPFAAYTTTDGLGVLVLNVGGTGVAFDAPERFFAEVAAAAAAGAASAPEPSADVVDQMETVAGDPCTWWSLEEIDAFLVDAPISAQSQPFSDMCRWDDPDNFDVYLEVTVLAPDTPADEFYEPAAAGSPIYLGGFRAPVLVLGDGYAVEIRVATSETDATPAMQALAENLVARAAG